MLGHNSGTSRLFIYSIFKTNIFETLYLFIYVHKSVEMYEGGINKIHFSSLVLYLMEYVAQIYWYTDIIYWSG